MKAARKEKTGCCGGLDVKGASYGGGCGNEERRDGRQVVKAQSGAYCRVNGWDLVDLSGNDEIK